MGKDQKNGSMKIYDLFFELMFFNLMICVGFMCDYFILFLKCKIKYSLVLEYYMFFFFYYVINVYFNF